MEHTHRVSKIIGVVLAVSALVLLLLWMQGILGGGKIEPGEVAHQEEVLTTPHDLDAVKTTSYVDWEEAVGTVKTKREVIIASRIMGTLVELPVKAGDEVREKALLARLDDRDVKSRLAQARSAVQEAESEFARASSDYKRFKKLRSQEAVTQQQYEQAVAAFHAAEARIRRSREAVKEAEVNLGYTVIRSPVNGYVVDKEMEIGDMASPGRPILLLQEGGPLRLEAAVREGLAGKINMGDKLPVLIDALDTELTGTVEEKVPVADPRSRSFMV